MYRTAMTAEFWDLTPFILVNLYQFFEVPDLLPCGLGTDE